MAIKVRAIANSITVGVNPNIDAILKANEGYEVDKYGNQTAKFTEHNIRIQPQSLSSQELQHLDLHTKQGQFISVYAYGRISAQRRWLEKGSEQVVFAPYGETDAVTWNVERVMESYSTWVRLILWRQ